MLASCYVCCICRRHQSVILAYGKRQVRSEDWKALDWHRSRFTSTEKSKKLWNCAASLAYTSHNRQLISFLLFHKKHIYIVVWTTAGMMTSWHVYTSRNEGNLLVTVVWPTQLSSNGKTVSLLLALINFLINRHVVREMRSPWHWRHPNDWSIGSRKIIT